MATTTTQLALRKPVGSDQVNVTTDVSDNMQKIDDEFHPTTGHDHSGTTGNGPKVDVTDLDDSAGTAGEVLTSNGAGNAPTMQAAAGGGKVRQQTIAVGSSSDITTNSSSYVDMTDMAVTLTTTGGDLICWFDCPYGQTGASIIEVYFAFSLDGGGEVGDHQLWTSASTAHQHSMSFMWRFTGVSSASHTVKVRWKVGSNTANSGDNTGRQLLMMEVDS